MAPVIPLLSDTPTPAQLRATVHAIAAAGATSVTPLVLRLRLGAREWFMAWLPQEHPYLVRRYEREPEPEVEPMSEPTQLALI